MDVIDEGLTKLSNKRTLLNSKKRTETEPAYSIINRGFVDEMENVCETALVGTVNERSGRSGSLNAISLGLAVTPITRPINKTNTSVKCGCIRPINLADISINADCISNINRYKLLPPPPLYKDLVNIFMLDQPPKYEDVTGIKLNNEVRVEIDFRVGAKIAEKAVCRSVFWYCILSAE